MGQLILNHFNIMLQIVERLVFTCLVVEILIGRVTGQTRDNYYDLSVISSVVGTMVENPWKKIKVKKIKGKDDGKTDKDPSSSEHSN